MHDYTYYNWDSVKSILEEKEISFSDLASITGINHQYYLDSMDSLENIGIVCEEINPIHEVSDGSQIRTYTSTDYIIKSKDIPKALTVVLDNVSVQIDEISQAVKTIHKLERE